MFQISRRVGVSCFFLRFLCAGKNGILVERCKIQMNQLTTQISDSSCNTSYVWLGGEGGKVKGEEGNNNVITIK